jgi:hypothetical protein
MDVNCGCCLSAMRSGCFLHAYWTACSCSYDSSQIYFHVAHPVILDRRSSVGIATRYGLDGPGIESR